MQITITFLTQHLIGYDTSYRSFCVGSVADSAIFGWRLVNWANLIGYCSTGRRSDAILVFPALKYLKPKQFPV